MNSLKNSTNRQNRSTSSNPNRIAAGRLAAGLVSGAAVGGGVVAALILGLGGTPNVTAQETVRVSATERATAVSLENAFAGVAEAVRPATVSISAVGETPAAASERDGSGGGGRGGEDEEMNEFFRGFGFPEPPAGGGGQRRNTPPPQMRPRRASGSGVIVRPDGYVLTNDHVVASGANGRVTVLLENGRKFNGQVFRDPRTDLAVVKILPEAGKSLPPLPYVSLANSDEIRVGQWAIAIGSPFGQQNTVTTGIVSALQRKSQIGLGLDRRYYPSLIQTDASINPGNSGGPLLNIKGELIGVNVAIFSPSGANVGIGFAIPANTARYVMNELISKGKVTRGFLGLTPEDLPPYLKDRYNINKGARILVVEGGSPADRAGIRENDIVTRFGDREVVDEVSMRDAISTSKPGASASVTLLRAGETRTTTVVVGGVPIERLAAESGSSAAGRPTPARAQAMAATPARVTARTLGILETQTLAESVANRIKAPAATGGETAGGRGVVVGDVSLGSAANEAGLFPGDIVLSANGIAAGSKETLERTLAQAKRGEVVTFSVFRPANPRIKEDNASRHAIDVTVP